jgi:FAD/FMN-containing dehydrogenase
MHIQPRKHAQEGWWQMTATTFATALEAIAAAIGADHVLTQAHDIAPHLREWRDLFHGQALAVVKPGSTQEVAAIVRIAREHGLAIVPQGGNTGLVGGQIPMGEASNEPPAIVLSLNRMTRIREVDTLTDTLTIEAGATLHAAQSAAEDAGRLFPLSLASEGSCTIGGNIATNAGGTAVLAYGNMRDLVLGLEVVLADGRIWNGLSKLRKDNTGYDLRHLFIGSEGTLGIVTAAVLKLFAQPRARATAFCAVPSPAIALSLLARTKANGAGTLTTFELMPRFGLDIVLKHVAGTRDPLAEVHPWYVLIEITSSADAALEAGLSSVLEAASDAGDVLDAVIATSLDQRAAFWRLREAMSETQRLEGGSIKHDIAVPVASVPAFLAEASAAVLKLIPDARPLPFGHLGDGNIHFNISQPVGADKAAFLARWGEVNAIVHGIVASYHGSVSAEHGIGRLKRGLLAKVKDPVAYDMMRAMKRTLDPDGLFNPGAVL